jgi:hypothetical protein
MATLNELAYNIRNIARSGQGNSDDDRLTISQIKFWISYYRSEGILQTTNYGKEIHPQMVQDLGVVPLVEVDATDSDCPTVQWGCKVKKVVVPKFVDFPKDRAIVFVGKIDKREPFILGNADVSYFKSATQFGTMMSRVSMIGDNMYFQLNDRDSELEYVNIRGVFEDPTKVDQYAVAGCKPDCFNDATSEYPLPLNLYVYVLSNILQKELQWNEAAVNDELNNARKDNQKIG